MSDAAQDMFWGASRNAGPTRYGVRGGSLTEGRNTRMHRALCGAKLPSCLHFACLRSLIRLMLAGGATFRRRSERRPSGQGQKQGRSKAGAESCGLRRHAGRSQSRAAQGWCATSALVRQAGRTAQTLADRMAVTATCATLGRRYAKTSAPRPATWERRDPHPIKSSVTGSPKNSAGNTAHSGKPTSAARAARRACNPPAAATTPRRSGAARAKSAAAAPPVRNAAWIGSSGSATTTARQRRRRNPTERRHSSATLSRTYAALLLTSEPRCGYWY